MGDPRLPHRPSPILVSLKVVTKLAHSPLSPSLHRAFFNPHRISSVQPPGCRSGIVNPTPTSLSNRWPLSPRPTSTYRPTYSQSYPQVVFQKCQIWGVVNFPPPTFIYFLIVNPFWLIHSYPQKRTFDYTCYNPNLTTFIITIFTISSTYPHVFNHLVDNFLTATIPRFPPFPIFPVTLWIDLSTSYPQVFDNFFSVWITLNLSHIFVRFANGHSLLDRLHSF